MKSLKDQILEQVQSGPVTIQTIQDGHAWTTVLVEITLAKLIADGLLVKDGEVYRRP